MVTLRSVCGRARVCTRRTCAACCAAMAPFANKCVKNVCWQPLARRLPQEEDCYGWQYWRLLRRYRPQCLVGCSTLRERAAGLPPNTSQVSLQVGVRYRNFLDRLGGARVCKHECQKTLKPIQSTTALAAHQLVVAKMSSKQRGGIVHQHGLSLCVKNQDKPKESL